jgi:Family of unknown function (DUF6525)
MVAMAGNAGASIGSAPGPKATPEQEMAAFEKLGPEVRTVLNDAVFPWSSVAVANRMKKMGMDPSNPEHDGAMADELSVIDSSKAESRQVP